MPDSSRSCRACEGGCPTQCRQAHHCPHHLHHDRPQQIEESRADRLSISRHRYPRQWTPAYAGHPTHAGRARPRRRISLPNPRCSHTSTWQVNLFLPYLLMYVVYIGNVKENQLLVFFSIKVSFYFQRRSKYSSQGQFSWRRRRGIVHLLTNSTHRTKSRR